MNVYLDDNRVGPIGPKDDKDIPAYPDWHNWITVRSVGHLKLLLKMGVVDNLSLDHDLGKDEISGEDYPNGSELVRWMAENNIWPTGIITIHSNNIVGAPYMKGVIDRYRPQE